MAACNVWEVLAKKACEAAVCIRIEKLTCWLGTQVAEFLQEHALHNKVMQTQDAPALGMTATVPSEKCRAIQIWGFGFARKFDRRRKVHMSMMRPSGRA